MNQIAIGSQWRDKKSGTIWNVVNPIYANSEIGLRDETIKDGVGLVNGSLDIEISNEELLEHFEPYIPPTIYEYVMQIDCFVNIVMEDNINTYLKDIKTGEIFHILKEDKKFYLTEKPFEPPKHKCTECGTTEEVGQYTSRMLMLCVKHAKLRVPRPWEKDL